MRRPLILFASLGLATLVALSGIAAPKKQKSTLGKKPPQPAVVLFNGANTDAWIHRGSGKPSQWQVKDGYMQVNGGDVVSKQIFTDFDLHVEFWLPLMADKKGQARANSGVYMQGHYEVQVLDSYGIDPPQKNDCGAVYGYYAPLVNACAKPETWQTFDIQFRAPRFDDDGNRTDPGSITVHQNGILIHQKVAVPEKPTTAAMGGDLSKPGPILLQDHGNTVRFRNVWLVEK